MRHVGSYRLFDSVLRRLAARGHEVDVVVNRRDSIEGDDSVARLIEDCPTVRWHWADEFAPSLWLEFATVVRLWLDYLRYFDPRYEHAPKLRARAEERVPGWIVRASTRGVLGHGHGRRILARLLRVVERALPRQAEADALIREQQPDAVLLTPLLHLGSPQIEVLRSARAQAVPTALCVGSWDHLSSKSVIRDAPDRVFVWNDTQRREAIDLHGLAADRVVVTGAQCFDHWFDRAPRRTREEFCRRVGLPADRPMLLWVCSALFQGSPVEAELVQRWVDRIRSSADELLSTASILIRPHPARLEEWRGVDLGRWPAVALHGALPIDDDSRDDYFDSLSHAAVVAGLNTSAFIEAAIVDRPLHTLMLPEFQENQEGTLHFHYLLPPQGPLIPARSFEEHERQLVESLRGGQPTHNRSFVDAFVRPAGRTRPAGEVFVASVEALAGSKPVAERSPAWAGAMRVALRPVALLTRALVNASGGDRTSHELRRRRQRADYLREKAEAELRHEEIRDRQRREKAANAEREREAVLRQRGQVRAEAERLKADIRREKERRKLEHQRHKRRALLKQRIKEKLGLA